VARALPDLRSATNEHLKRSELDREKVMATIVRLMTRAYFRVGSERYAVKNKTFGICTLGKRHVEVSGNNVVFTYVGKRRKDQRQVVAATPLVEVVEELIELPGRRLFQYLENGGGGGSSGATKRGGKAGASKGGSGKRRRRKPKPVTARNVNDYLREVVGEKITSKDLRTFGGTVRAATILSDIGPAPTDKEAKSNVVLTCKLVAAELGNTPAICRKAYIHPAVLSQYELSGRTIDMVDRGRKGPVPAVELEGFYPEEIALMRFLERFG
jgi:DNA topoisomerase-1